MSEDIKITVTYTAPDALCADILCTALEGGIGYWSQADDIKRGPPNNHEIKPYISARLAPPEDEEWFEPVLLDYTAIRRGMKLAMEVEGSGRVKACIATALANNDAGEIDAEAADVIVQFGVFGAIIYG